MLPLVRLTVTVIAEVPERLATGTIVKIRFEPLPVTLRFAGLLGTRVVLLEVAVIEVIEALSRTSNPTTTVVSSLPLVSTRSGNTGWFS